MVCPRSGCKLYVHKPEEANHGTLSRACAARKRAIETTDQADEHRKCDRERAAVES